MLNPKISYIIPHRGRDAILLWHLRELKHQSFKDFEIIISLDMTKREAGSLAEEILITYPGRNITVLYAGNGPAATRNKGALISRSDILLFAGSDCVPHRDLIARHYWKHTSVKDVQTVQGVTPWHFDVVTEFYNFIDASGLQAAWNNLKNDDGSWKHDISPSFCLTTNYSIKRQLFLNERFNETFSGAAWEDVEFAYRVAKRSPRAVFDHLAINYHYHRYDLESFAYRSMMEGYHRPTICKLHPEMAWNMLNPKDLQQAEEIDEHELLMWARELDAVSGSGDQEGVEQLMQAKFTRYLECCKVFSLKGVLKRIKDEHPAMQAIKYATGPKEAIAIVSGVRSLDDEKYAFANHCAHWLLNDHDEDAFAWNFYAEVEETSGNTEVAEYARNKAVGLDPNLKWKGGDAK
jgi:glycosyltransferase involved in cell wall biosynthesis